MGRNGCLPYTYGEQRVTHRTAPFMEVEQVGHDCLQEEEVRFAGAAAPLQEGCKGPRAAAAPQRTVMQPPCSHPPQRGTADAPHPHLPWEDGPTYIGVVVIAVGGEKDLPHFLHAAQEERHTWLGTRTRQVRAGRGWARAWGGQTPHNRAGQVQNPRGGGKGRGQRKSPK